MKWAGISQGAQLGVHSQKDQDSIAGSDRCLSLRHITRSNFRIHRHGVVKMPKLLETKHTRLIARLKCMELYTHPFSIYVFTTW